MSQFRCPECGHLVHITRRPTVTDRYLVTSRQADANIIRCQRCGCQVKRPLPKIDQRDGPPPAPDKTKGDNHA